MSDKIKILMVNGSPHEHGSTDRALKEMQKVFEQNGVDSEIFWLGTKPIGGCIACNACLTTKRCVFQDKVNEFLDKCDKADGFVFASPVHYAGISGSLTGFMDRAFYGKHNLFRLKPACAVVSARRMGTTSAIDIINKYFTIAEMPIVSSSYWNGVHGRNAQETVFDEEGLQTVRNLASNMVWLARCIKNSGIEKPIAETPVIKTNYIR